MTKDERFNIFWDKYKPLNGKAKMKAKEAYLKAESRWLKRNPEKSEDDFPNYVVHQIGLDEDHRKLQKRAGKFVPDWPMPATYLNQDRFEDEFEDSSFDLQEKAKERNREHQCCIEGCTESIYVDYVANRKDYYCTEHDLEHNYEDKRNELRHYWMKANERVPKLQSETHREHHRRYVEKIRKEQQIMMRLPYNKASRTADEQSEYDEKELLQNWQTVEPDKEKEAEYRERYGVRP